MRETGTTRSPRHAAPAEPCAPERPTEDMAHHPPPSYETLGQIGRDACGAAVYLARHIGWGRLVTLRFRPANARPDQGRRSSFRVRHELDDYLVPDAYTGGSSEDSRDELDGACLLRALHDDAVVSVTRGITSSSELLGAASRAPHPRWQPLIFTAQQAGVSC